MAEKKAEILLSAHVDSKASEEFLTQADNRGFKKKAALTPHGPS